MTLKINKHKVLLAVFAAMLAVMAIFEFVKQFVFPNISVWQSHLATIGFSSTIALLIVYFILGKYEKLENSRIRMEGLGTRLGRIVEQSVNEVYILDAETLQFIAVNHGARENLGYTIDQLKLLTPYDLKPEFTRQSFEQLVKPLRDGVTDSIAFQTVHKRKDGSTYDIEVFLQLMPLETPPVFVAIILDITERKQAEEALRKAHDELEARVEERTRELSMITKEARIANRAKSDLMANMSHELRTPLNAIIGFSSSIKEETYGPLGHDKYSEYINDISNSGQHLLELINDILDVSAIEAGKLELSEENLDVGKVVEATIRLISGRAKDAGIHLISNNHNGLPMLYADRRRLMQIFLNLLSNAIKFTPPDGEVSFATSLNGGNAHIFTVTDTGIGMDEEELALAMSEFGQLDSGLARKHEGTGLGLPLTKGLVELHGGTLEVKSKKGKGTRITVSFPRRRVSETGI